jgi:hypothetical protein
MRDRITVPAWANRIRVEQLSKSLLVAGDARVQDAVALASRLPSVSKGLLDRYVPLVEVGRKQGIVPPHLEFAQAKERNAQIAFVEKYGPIWGDVMETMPRIIVEQQMRILKREQRIFSIVASMVAEVRRERRANIKQLESLCLRLLSEGGFAPGLGHEAILHSIVQQNLPMVLESGSKEERRMMEDFYTYHAHWMIGIAADRFPPKLTYFAGHPVELPPHSLEGVLPMLYFLLRRDYLAADRRISSCANVNCRTLFAIERSGQKFCSSECSALQRGRDYWHQAGKKRRQERRKE